MQRRPILLCVWFLSMIIVGILISNVTGRFALGWASTLSLIAISLGVPLMRAFTEHSK